MITARAHARVGLLGNPSDLYGGRGLGFSVRELTAEAVLRDAEAIDLGGTALARAAFGLVAAQLAQRGASPESRPCALACSSTIPYQSGLAGSSALVTAMLRAWSDWYGLHLSRTAVAELALRAENDVLGIRAGPLDRLVQAHDGLLAMDFREPFAPHAIARLDPALLPPLLLVMHRDRAALAPPTSSGDVHAPIHARFQAGDPAVRSAMAALAANADAGRAALEAGDAASFLACVDRNLELRGSVFDLHPADLRLAAEAREAGAAAKLPGSGGAVLVACRDEATCTRLDRRWSEAGHWTLRPEVAAPQPRIRAVFLAAGFATRLHPITLDRAKPLLEIGGEPMLTRILRQVARMDGVVDGVVVTNARFHASFEAWRATAASPFPLEIVNDGAATNEARLGAVRDLALALAEAPARDDIDAYLVLACDNLFDLDLQALVRRHAETGRGQLVVREVPPPVPGGTYSEVRLDEGGRRVVRFREKPAVPESNLSAIAVYLLPRELPDLVREYLGQGGAGDAPGHLLAWLSERLAFDATPLEGRWLDIGSAADLARASETI